MWDEEAAAELEVTVDELHRMLRQVTPDRYTIDINTGDQ